MGPPPEHAYFFDGERRVIPPIHPHWYTARGIEELNVTMRAPPVVLRVKEIERELAAALRVRFTTETVRLTREVNEKDSAGVAIFAEDVGNAKTFTYTKSELFASPRG